MSQNWVLEIHVDVYYFPLCLKKNLANSAQFQNHTWPADPYPHGKKWFLSMRMILTRWCPPSYKLVYNPINYRYTVSTIVQVIRVINQLSYLGGTTLKWSCQLWSMFGLYNHPIWVPIEFHFGYLTRPWKVRGVWFANRRWVPRANGIEPTIWVSATSKMRSF